MSFVIVEKNQNNVPTESELESAINAVNGVFLSAEGGPASRKVEFTGEINHTQFENALIRIARGRRTSWNFAWGDALQLYVDQANALNTLLAASRKSVKIQISAADLTTLKNSKYKLCFAKKVGDSAYNVVWQAYGKFTSTSNFSWLPQYQLFGTNSFDSSVQVDVSTNLVSIGLGETSVLNSVGLLEAPRTGGDAHSITMKNNYDVIHPGINQLSTGVNGAQVSTPIYVAQEPVVTGVVELKPIEKVLVWFEQDIETSTMFSSSRSDAIEIDLTDTNAATRLYSAGKWTTP